MDTSNDKPGRAQPFPFDAVYKALFRDPDTVRDMLRNHLAGPAGPLGADLVAALDLGTLRRLPAEWVTRDFHARRGDQVWCVDFRADAGNWPRRLFIHLEFQSREDGSMALRFLEYGGELFRELRGTGGVGTNEPCAILCVAVCNGAAPWRAPTRMGDLVRLPPVFGRATVPPTLAAFFPWGYHPLDLVRIRDGAPVPGSIVSLIAAIEYAGATGLPEVLRGPLLRTAQGLGPLMRETVAAWMRRLAAKYGIELSELEELMRLEDVPPVTSRLEESLDAAFAQARAAGAAAGIEEGIEQGIEQGIAQRTEQEREMLCRMAAMKFGATTAEQMRALLGGVAAAPDMQEVGECLMQATRGTELLACIRAVLQRNGSRPV